MGLHPVTRARLRAQAETFLTDKCVIERVLVGQGDFMTPQNEWRIIATGVKCRLITGIKSSYGQVAEISEQEVLKEYYSLAVPIGTEIQADDRVMVNDVTYTVLRMETEFTDEFFTQVLLTRRRGADYD